MVVGGKPATYRLMAEQAVTAAVRRYRLAAGPPRTATLPLVGAAARDQLRALDAPPRLVHRYGTEAPAVHALSTIDNSLGEPLGPGLDTTGAELVWALRHEGALDLDDLLDRRTRIGLVPADRRAAQGTAQRILAA